MSIDDIQFPPQIAYGATGGPMFSTDVIVNSSGFEQRNANWTASLNKYDVSTGLKSPTDLNTLIAFFRGRQGRLRGFRFKDFADFQINAQTIATADGIVTAYQIVKTYVSGTQTYTRKITRPVSGTVTGVTFNGVPKTEGVGFTINYATGILTQTPAVAGPIVIGYIEFDVPARFDTDDMQTTVEGFETHVWHNIPVIEVRE